MTIFFLQVSERGRKSLAYDMVLDNHGFMVPSTACGTNLVIPATSLHLVTLNLDSISRGNITLAAWTTHRHRSYVLLKLQRAMYFFRSLRHVTQGNNAYEVLIQASLFMVELNRDRQQMADADVIL